MTSSLLVPAALLAGALVVAVGGSGADAVSSLGQLTRGPDIPLTSVDMVDRNAPVGADVTQLDADMLASSAPGQASGRTAGTAAGGPDKPAAGANGSSGSSPNAAPKSQGGSSGGTAGRGQSGNPTTSTPSRAPANPTPSSPTPANPVGKTLDQTQQNADHLLKPVKPITDQVLGGLGR